MHVMEVRETMQDVKESVFGNRMDIGANIIGGVRYDITPESAAYLRAQLDKIAPQIEEITKIYRTNGSILGRTRGVGVLTQAQAIDCSVVGPVARAAGIDYDVRIKAPYSAYDQLDVPVHTLKDGDVWSRAMIRLARRADRLHDGTPADSARRGDRQVRGAARRADLLRAHRRFAAAGTGQVACTELHELGCAALHDEGREDRRYRDHREQYRPVHFVHGAVRSTCR